MEEEGEMPPTLKEKRKERGGRRIAKHVQKVQNIQGATHSYIFFYHVHYMFKYVKQFVN